MGKVGTSGGSSLDFLWPVGSLYSTLDAGFDPNVNWGGTWVKVGENLTLRQAGASHPVGTRFGEAEHLLTMAELPNERAPLTAGEGRTPIGPIGYEEPSLPTGVGLVWQEGPTYPAWGCYLGKSKAHNNIGPSLSVNIWQRTK